jgi:hypothetical protein
MQVAHIVLVAKAYVPLLFLLYCVSGVLRGER